MRLCFLTIPIEKVEPVRTLLDSLLHAHNIQVFYGITEVSDLHGSSVNVVASDSLAEINSSADEKDTHKHASFGFNCASVTFKCVPKHSGPIVNALGVATKPMLHQIQNTSGKKKKKYSLTDSLTFEEIYMAIDDQVHLTFDYLLMTVVAALIAGVGLIVNSSVLVVASMLVSPLMGPILGMTLGFVIGDYTLAWKSVRNELWGILATWLTGFAVGAFCSPLRLDEVMGYYDPNSEMNSRGSALGLYTGVAVAIPSGVGVSLAFTGGTLNPLVGVAISAALLPPIVNSGLNFALAIFRLAHVGVATDHSLHWFTNSWVSMILFLINWLLIWVFGSILFMLKDLAHLTTFASQTPDYLYRKPTEHTSLLGKEREETYGAESESDAQ